MRFLKAIVQLPFIVVRPTDERQDNIQRKKMAKDVVKPISHASKE
jgi:hypothetical protein